MRQKVRMLTANSPFIPVIGARTCYNSFKHMDALGEKDLDLLDRLSNRYRHESVIEHLVVSYEIITSREVLQEIARHRIASYSVKSTRYTLKELKNAKEIDPDDYCIIYSKRTNKQLIKQLLEEIQKQLQNGATNDEVKEMLPECFATTIIMTVNARSLKNFLNLRLSESAYYKIREIAELMLLEFQRVFGKDYTQAILGKTI